MRGKRGFSEKIPKERLEEILSNLMQLDSIKLNTLRNCEYLSLPKKSLPIVADASSQKQVETLKLSFLEELFTGVQLTGVSRRDSSRTYRFLKIEEHI